MPGRRPSSSQERGLHAGPSGLHLGVRGRKGRDFPFLWPPYSHWVTHVLLPPEQQAKGAPNHPQGHLPQPLGPGSQMEASRKPGSHRSPLGQPEFKEQTGLGGRGPALVVRDLRLLPSPLCMCMRACVYARVYLCVHMHACVCECWRGAVPGPQFRPLALFHTVLSDSAQSYP